MAFARIHQRFLALVLTLSLMPVTPIAATLEADVLDFYLMDLTADGYLLAEGVYTYKRDDTYFIHFASFLEAVEFSIHRQGSVWTGWFRNEETRFMWDTETSEVQIGSVAPTSPSAPSVESDEGTFVSLDALEGWFDLDLRPEPRTQTIAVASADLLPFQRRDARESARNRFRPHLADEADVRVPDQYQWATRPLIDLSTRYDLRGGGGETHSDTQSSLTMSMDLLKHSLLYSGSIASESGHRLTISRSAPVAGGTLAPGVDSYALGDVFDDGSNLVNGGGLGAGFSIKRRSRGNHGSQSRVTINGDGPPGWEAELYRNNLLIAFGSVSGDGLYSFPDQETGYGQNLFVVKLHGPQGQIREQAQSYWGGGIDLKQGDHSVSISHVDFTRRLIGGRVATDTSTLPAEETTSLHYARALSPDLQLGAGYTRASVGSRTPDDAFAVSEYLTVDGRLNIGKGLILTELVRQKERGSAWSMQYLTGLGSHSLSISRQEFRDFESPYTVRRVETDAQSQLMLSGPMDVAGLNGYAFRLTHQDRADGLADFRIFSRLGASWGPANLSNELDYLRVSSGEEFLLGRLHITGRWKQMSLRTQLDYDPASPDPLIQVSTMLRWSASKQTHYSVSAYQNLQNGRAFQLDSTVTTRVGKSDVSLSVSTDSDDHWSVGLALGTRFGYEGAEGFAGYQGALAHTGRATLNLFLDANNNGVQDLDESSLDWAAYKGHEISESTPGSIKFAGVPAHVPLRLESEDFRFNDPFLVPRDDVYEIYTHPGSRLHADIPVVMTGDVEGQLHPVPGTRAGVVGLTVVLYGAGGEVVATTHSEFDGYYSFHGIAAGNYEVVVDTAAAQADVQRQWFSFNGEAGYLALSPMFIYWN